MTVVRYLAMMTLCLLHTPFTVFAAPESLVVIDPGHSISSRGAISCSGKGENVYNQILAQQIVQRISTPNRKVLVTTTGESLSLGQRAKLSKGADIFLSIHHDSVQPQFIKILKAGDTVKYCSKKATGFSIFVSKNNPQYKSSFRLAQRLGVALLNRGLTPTLHHAELITGESRTLLDNKMGIYQFDRLEVLKKAQSPAILLEAAVIVHPDNDKLAQTKTFQQNIADAVAEMMEYIIPGENND